MRSSQTSDLWWKNAVFYCLDVEKFLDGNGDGVGDFLVNHTSDQHPRVRSALRSKDSKYRDYYVWRSEEPPNTAEKVVFPDKEDSIWTKDDSP